MFFIKLMRAGVAGAGILLLSACGIGAASSAAPPNKTDIASAPPNVAAIAPAGAPPLFAWSNGEQIPASFPAADFDASGPLYQRLPASPQLDPQSAQDISYYFAGTTSEFEVGSVDINKNQAGYDYNFPMYIASPSDPLVTIVCGNLSCPDGGAQINMPALAQQAGGTDHHLAVLEPNGTEYDFWLVSSNPPYSNGSRFNAAGEGHYSTGGGGSGPNYVAPGFDVESATAGGIALSIGQIYTSELATGVINHAISLVFPCGANRWVYPASSATGMCENGQGMPLGSRVWWQPTAAQTNAMSLPRDIITVLTALHTYGGFFTDNDSNGNNVNGGGGGMGSRLENQEPYWIYGNGTDPALKYAAGAQGWNHVTASNGVNRYTLAVPAGSADFADNLKVIAPCVTLRTC